MPGIYVHIPFCQKKCFYCDFFSIENLPDIEKFIEYLIKEIDIRSEIWNRTIGRSKNYEAIFNTVFIGGGTPSLLSAKQMKKITDALKSRFLISGNAEWTVETNPGTLNSDSLKKYKKTGFNRISIGVQSFVDSELNFLQRIHNSNEAVKAILDSKKAGFFNRNIDIIFSIPGQTIESLRISMDTINKLMPEHISAYSLIYEKGTPLYSALQKNLIQKIEDDTDAELYGFISEFLVSLGYEHYEVSNYALPGFKCIHNKNYWDRGEYIGLGPSAHGYLNGRRYWNVKTVNSYFKMLDKGELPEIGFENLTRENIISEKIMLGIRSEGIKFKEFKKEFNIDLFELGYNNFQEWKNKGLCEFDKEKIRLNHKGYFICNTLIIQLVNLI